MTSTFSTNKNLELPGYNDYVDTWNVPLNADMNVLDKALGGSTSINTTGLTGTITLTATQYQPLSLIFSGAPSGALVYGIPSGVGGQWTVTNNTTGTYKLYMVSAAGGTPVEIQQGYTTIVSCDGGSSGMRLSVNTPATASGSNTQVQYNSGGSFAGSANLTFSGTLLTTTSLSVTGTTTMTGAVSAPGGITGDLTGNVTGNVSGTAGNVSGVVAVANGGTGASTAATARTNLGLGTIATQAANSVSITGGSITGITDLAVADGGTGASTAASARVNLLPSYTGNQSKVLALNSGATDVEWVTVSTGSGGTVTSVAASGGSTGMSFSGSPITTSGTLTLAGTLALGNGGTNATTAAGARSNLLPTYTSNAGKVLAVNAGATDVEWIASGGSGTVTSVNASGGATGLTFSGGPITAAGTLTLAGTLAVANGGTGSTTSSGARSALGLAIGTDVQAYNANLAAVSGLSTTGLMARTGAGAATTRTITGTSNRLDVSNGDGVAGNPTLDISASYSGQSSISTVGTITTGTWNGTTIAAANGGTGLTSYTIGDLVYASGTTTLAKLADVATGNALLSGGVGVAPAWGKIGLTTHVTGALPIANGGTAATTVTTARVNLLPSYTSNAGKVLAINAGGTDVEWIAPGGGGTVTSIDVSGGTTGLTALGGPVTAAGTITLAGTLNVANGGTGSTTASGARTSLGLGIGSDVQAFSTYLNALSGLGTNGINVRTGTNTAVTRSIAGTTNRTTVTNGDGVSGNPTVDIAATYAGQSSITTLGTITSGVWNGTAVDGAYGGTGQTTYAIGDLLYASSSTTLSRLADVATGSALISGGVGIAPTWGKVGLTTHVTGTLPVSSGGTGATTLSGLLKGNGTSAVSAATAGTDYMQPNVVTNGKILANTSNLTAQFNIPSLASNPSSFSAGDVWNYNNQFFYSSGAGFPQQFVFNIAPSLVGTVEVSTDNITSPDGFVLQKYTRNTITIGSVTQTGGGTSVLYNTTSDYRLKKNVRPIASASSKVMDLKPVTYEWKASSVETDGFLAHELQATCPYAVSGEKDAVNADGSINPQGVDMSKVVPLLTAALQDALTRVQALEARIAALEK